MHATRLVAATAKTALALTVEPAGTLNLLSADVVMMAVTAEQGQARVHTVWVELHSDRS